MKLTLMLWTAAAAAAVTVQLLAAASLEMEEKELEDALATREVEVERRGWHWQDQELIVLNALSEAFQTLLRYAKKLQRMRGRGRGRGRARYPGYDDPHRKRVLEGQGADAKESVAEQDAVALCREFLDSQKVGDAGGKAKRQDKEQEDGKQEENQEEGKQEENQGEVDLKDLVQTQRMLEFCLGVMD